MGALVERSEEQKNPLSSLDPRHSAGQIEKKGRPGGEKKGQKATKKSSRGSGGVT